jgi:hypothetical protein
MNQSLLDFAARLRSKISPPQDPFECGFSDPEFNELAMQLFGLQFEANAPFRALCEARGRLPGSVDRWQSIPAMPTSAFKSFEVSCIPGPERTKVFASSGTTGQTSSRHFHFLPSLQVYEASLVSAFDHRLGTDWRNMGLISLTPPPDVAPHSSLVHMISTLMKEGREKSVYLGEGLGDGSWGVDWGGFEEECKRGKPKLIFGTAFSFVHLLDFFGSDRRPGLVPASSIIFETGGYKGRSRTIPKAELHRLLRHALGGAIQVLTEYGMSELGSQAYEFFDRIADGLVFRFPAWARVRIVSPETGDEAPEGEMGLIEVCDLANVFSVMMVQTEDLGIRRGDGFEFVGRAEASEPRGCSMMPSAPGYANR